MFRKLDFYVRHGVEEFYIIDPDAQSLFGWQVHNGASAPVLRMNGWVSPRLGITFQNDEDGIRILNADGTSMNSYRDQFDATNNEKDRADVAEGRAKLAEGRADSEKDRADSAEDRADSAEDRAKSEKNRADALAEQLRALGVAVDNQ